MPASFDDIEIGQVASLGATVVDAEALDAFINRIACAVAAGLCRTPAEQSGTAPPANPPGQSPAS